AGPGPPAGQTPGWAGRGPGVAPGAKIGGGGSRPGARTCRSTSTRPSVSGPPAGRPSGGCPAARPAGPMVASGAGSPAATPGPVGGRSVSSALAIATWGHAPSPDAAPRTGPPPGTLP